MSSAERSRSYARAIRCSSSSGGFRSSRGAVWAGGGACTAACAGAVPAGVAAVATAATTPVAPAPRNCRRENRRAVFAIVTLHIGRGTEVSGSFGLWCRTPQATITVFAVRRRRLERQPRIRVPRGVVKAFVGCLWSTESFDDVLGPGTWFNGTDDP